MDNVIAEKRGLVVILVVATVVIFIGLVWGITKFLPLNILGSTSPSHTPEAPVVVKNCTYPVSYWQEHPERYPSQLVIGGLVYKAKEVSGILSDDPQGVWLQLQAQLIGTYLNYLAGADQNKIEATIFEAYGWLVRNPASAELSDSKREAGNMLLEALTAYNLGLTDVPACEPGLALTLARTGTATGTPELLLTSTASETPTATPSETPTPTPSETPTPIKDTATATYEFIQPTRAATRTLEPTIYTPPNTPVPPVPTNTPIPNTPTNIPPQPTATFILPPLPTATNTLAPHP